MKRNWDVPPRTCGCREAVAERINPSTGGLLELCHRHAEAHDRGAGFTVYARGERMTNMKYDERREFAREWGEALGHHQVHGDKVRERQNTAYWCRWLATHALTPEDAQDLILERVQARALVIARAQA